MIFPSLRQSPNAHFSLKKCSVTVENDSNYIIEKALNLENISVVNNGNVLVKAVFSDEKELRFIDETLKHSDEKYFIKTHLHDESVLIEINYTCEKSLWHAANTLSKMISSNCFFEGEITDYPLFEVRGYIEGFYGNPWKHNQRLEMIKLMAHNHMNTYFYAPKNDVYHREKWHELYPKKELSDIKELVSFTDEYYIDLNFCIAPGLNICYSNDEHIERLVNKFIQLYEIGITGFGLLLDDIPFEMHYEEDKAKFENIAQAHVYLINSVYQKLIATDEKIKLTVCPLVYHGDGDEKYIKQLGKGLSDEVNIFWTGNNICSQQLRSNDALYFEKNTLHKPLYWDNYPVNDAEMFNEMHLGPISGRDKTLYLHSKGLISNTMEYFESSKVALLTIADYLWNPIQYDSELSWKNALSIMTSGNEETFIYFADHLKTSCLKQPCSEIMAECLFEAAFYRSLGNNEAVKEVLSEYNQKLSECVRYLNNSDSAFLRELDRWIKKFCLCCEIMKHLEELYGGNDNMKEIISEKMKNYNYNSTVLTEFCFREFVEIALE